MISASWADPAVRLEDGALQDLLIKAADETIEWFGGPKQFLQARFHQVERATAFAAWLLATLPTKPGLLDQLAPR